MKLLIHIQGSDCCIKIKPLKYNYVVTVMTKTICWAYTTRLKLIDIISREIDNIKMEISSLSKANVSSKKGLTFLLKELQETLITIQ